MFLPECYKQIAMEALAVQKAQHAERLQRNQSPEIRILLVSKYQSWADIQSALDYFHQCQLSGSLVCPNLGENYVQGAAQRLQELQHYRASWVAEEPPEGASKEAVSGISPMPKWKIPELEMIGSLQSNKAARACQLFSTLHSVSSAKLLHALAKSLTNTNESRKSPRSQGSLVPINKPLHIFFQYNASAEPQKNGCSSYDELRLLLDELLQMEAPLLLHGLMCMSFANASSTVKQRAFADCRVQAERLWCEYANTGKSRLTPYFELSMGMSGDYAEALAEGANVLRIGSRLFAE